jgi:hypothetical protein
MLSPLDLPKMEGMADAIPSAVTCGVVTLSAALSTFRVRHKVRSGWLLLKRRQYSTRSLTASMEIRDAASTT